MKMPEILIRDGNDRTQRGVQPTPSLTFGQRNSLTTLKEGIVDECFTSKRDMSFGAL